MSVTYGLELNDCALRTNGDTHERTPVVRHKHNGRRWYIPTVLLKQFRSSLGGPAKIVRIAPG
jgi:hypothetical protein